jgi:excinuclease ABC subunit A
VLRNAPAQLLTVHGARQHNLRNLEVSFPLGAFIVVTGVSGSGKSSLINDVLYNTLARRLHRARTPAAAVDDVTGIEQIDKVISVDQAPIGNSPLSNPATYTGVFDLIRQLFAQLPEAKVRGYQPRRFSFTRPGGRCEACEGNGQKVIEMHFLPDVWVECDVCHGQRYNPETLAVRYKGRSIADALSMTVREALEVFGNIPKIRRVLQTLADVGLDYLSLGQAAPTLSGGEAQRVKLAAELARPSTGRTLYILDEPTTGLHFDDVHKLLDVLNRLVDLGNTVIVVEHNLDVIKTADWVIDLGPEAGPGGGRLVVAGTPEEIVNSRHPSPRPPPRSGEGEKKNSSPSPLRGGGGGRGFVVSHTAAALAPVLAAGPHAERPRFDPHAADQPRGDDVPLELVGRDAALPWQTDGRRWHTAERITTDGKACRWEGAILDWIDARVHEVGEFGETDWSERTVVEVPGVKKSDGWFLHAMTSMEWLVRLVFRVGKNAFNGNDLDRRLGIKPLNETPGLQVYSSEPRVWTTSHKKGPWQSVTLLVYRLEEIDTPAFRSFLKEAAVSYHNAVKRLNTKPEDVMPWKLNGERWHLGEKGFPPGRRVRWDRALLPRFLELARQVEPNLEVKWDARDAITLKVPGVSRGWGYIRTKEAEALVCRFVGKRGGLNLAQVESIGVRPEIQDNRSDGDALVLTFEQLDQLPAAKLKPVLAEHLHGFREVFGRNDPEDCESQ